MQHNLPFDPSLDDSITQALQQRCKKYFERTDFYAEYLSLSELKQLVPTLVAQLQKLDINLDMAGFMCTPPGVDGTIHIDGDPEYPKYWALNLPIYNCHNTAMTWWHCTSESKIIQSKHLYQNTPIRQFDKKDCKEIERCVLNQATWVNVGVPHSVENLANTANRMILTLRFDVSKLQDWHPDMLKRQH